MAIKYGRIKNMFNDFCKHKGRQYDFEDIDCKFYQNFNSYMIIEKKYSVTTIGSSMKFLKTILNDAVTNKLHTNIEFKEILKGKTEDSDAVYLNNHELKLLCELDLKILKAR
jgi:hypothetical protein